MLLAVVAIGVTVVVGPRDLGFFGAGFAALSLVGITWVYVLTPYELTSYLGSNGDRVIMAPVLGAAALVPLLVEETALALAGTRRPEIVVTQSLLVVAMEGASPPVCP